MNIRSSAISRVNTHPRPGDRRSFIDKDHIKSPTSERRPSSHSSRGANRCNSIVIGGHDSECSDSDDYQISMPDDVQFEDLALFPKFETIPRFIYVLLSEPTQSIMSLMIGAAIMLLIIASCITFLLESLRMYKYPQVGEEEDDTLPLFADFEVVAISIFTVEYGLRCITAHSVPYPLLGHPEDAAEDKPRCCFQCMHKTWYFIKSPFNVIDLLAIIPFYIGLIDSHTSAVSQFSFLRILRLARVFRVFKLGKYTEGIVLYSEVFKKSGQAIYLLMFFSVLTAIVMGSFVYLFEKGDFTVEGCKEWNYETKSMDVRDCFLRKGIVGSKVESPFYNIFSAMWWVFTTMTTVGYGDIYPTTWPGKIIAVLTMHLGVLGLALPISIIGTNFHEVFNHRQEMRLKAKLEREASTMTRTAADGIEMMAEIQCSIDLINSEFIRIQDLVKRCNEQLTMSRRRQRSQRDSHSMPTVPRKGSRLKNSLSKVAHRLKVAKKPTPTNGSSENLCRSPISSQSQNLSQEPSSSDTVKPSTKKSKSKYTMSSDIESAASSQNQMQSDAVSDILRKEMDFVDQLENGA